MAGILLRKDSVWELIMKGDIELYKTREQNRNSCSAKLTALQTVTLGVECRKRGLGTGFVRRSLEMNQADQLGSQGSGSSYDGSREVRVRCSGPEAWRATLGKSQNSEPWWRVSSSGDMVARMDTVTIKNLSHRHTWFLDDVTFKKA